MDFQFVKPEEVGIQEEWLISFLNRLEMQGLPMHSAIIARQGKICMETYYQPYNKDSLHRMFSVTKSMAAMAIGLLIEEGKLSLSDKIIDFFPDKLPEEGVYPYMAMLTIKDMLEMKTCHDKTTYKGAGVTDWVGSFFTTKPTHVPGTSFAYDTSSTHVLGALVERLSGKTFLDYLREKCLNELGFSKEAHVLCDPYGVPMGGSGLCATTRDLYILTMLMAGNGNINGKQYLPEDFMKSAIEKHSDSYANQGTLEELQGYGYQIWCTRHGGNALFGMGGQLGVYIPNQDIYMVTTCDAQGRQGGVQLIYEAFFEEIYDKLAGKSTYDTPALSLEEYINSRSVIALPGDMSSPMQDKINHTEYICDENPSGIKTIKVDFDESQKGKVIYTTAAGTHTISFGLGSTVTGELPVYGYRYAASGSWRMDNYLLIRINIIDDEVGNVYMGLNYKDDYITVVLKKVVENKLGEYQGVFSGKC